MANTAAHLVDRVLPAVPLRQWVLSLPFELRALAAFRADVLSALSRIFIDAVFARYRAFATRVKLELAAPGAVTHVQRFGSSINLNVHFHTMVLDGVFTRDAKGRPVFHAAPAPTREELCQIVDRVYRRAVAWLKLKGHLAAPDNADSQAAAAQTALDACAAMAVQRGSVLALRDDDTGAAQEILPGVDRPPVDAGAPEQGGFNLHASVAIDGDDDLGRERLMRYGARPPLALDRLRRLAGGRIGYRIKKLRDKRAKHRVMAPLELLARLAALVPPPRYPLLRYHGVLAPRSSWRREIVPRPRALSPPKRCVQPKASRKQAAEPRRHDLLAPSSPGGVTSENDARSRAAGAAPAILRSLSGRPQEQHERADAAWLAPNVVSVKHWSRLLGGLLYPATPRVDWATLLRRTFDVDVLRCSECGGRMRMCGEIRDPAVVRLVLETLGMPAEAPRVARARDPTDLFGQTEVG